jgi:arsenate reductase-like glutaredoxin family protein
MNLEELKNKTILLFGKSRAFSADEFQAQMKFHKISIVKEYSEDVVLVVDGKMMTPNEQNASDKLYEEKKASFIAIDSLEKELAKSIDANTLLMSLKLSRDKSRLKDFLTNSMIDDELYLKLLKMYSWGGEDFFDNDDNRDVSAALMLRFYENIERNHNVEYATLGLMHLIIQSKNEKLIEEISLLEPLQRSMLLDSKDVNYKIISAMATNYATPKSVLVMLVKKSNSYIRTLIAMREDSDEEMQEKLLNSSDEEVLEALSYNANLSKKIVEKLLSEKNYVKNIAKNIQLDSTLFDMFLQDYSGELAKNESTTLNMQEKLISFHNQDIMLSLATNEHLDEKLIVDLLCEGSENIKYALYENIATPKESLEEAYDNVLNHFSLANNENTPEHILELLAQSGDVKVLKSLAKNLSTPVETLYQLQLDSRLERDVKENPAFGNHIMRENIGWQV